ncbi:MAG: pyridoxal phosphate-dependent aminotransferase [Nitrososphaerales archaeon]
MNLNENLVFPQNQMRSILVKCIDRLDPRFYPAELREGELDTLGTEIAKYCGCSKRSIVIGVGSDQILDLIFRMKLGSRGKMVTVDPTYSMYSVLAKRLGADVDFVRVRSSTAKEPFSLALDELIASAKRANILVIASPNNPTGVQYPIDEIRALIQSLPETLVVIDEAYVEYADYSTAGLLKSNKKLIITRTFSKAFGLASLRLGYLLSSDENFINELSEKFQYPYPVSGFSVLMATELLRRKSLVLEYAEKTKSCRKELIEYLQKLGDKFLKVVPRSDSNFVVVRSKRSKSIAEELLSKYSVAVKYIPKMGLETEFLRITVGSREMNQKLLYSLRRIAGA